MTPKQKRDQYLEAVRRDGLPMPTDEQIEAITGYSNPWKKAKGWLIAIFLGLFWALITMVSNQS